MTPDEVRVAAIDLVRRTTREQGLPERVTDPMVLAKLSAAVAPQVKPRGKPQKTDR